MLFSTSLVNNSGTFRPCFPRNSILLKDWQSFTSNGVKLSLTSSFTEDIPVLRSSKSLIVNRAGSPALLRLNKIKLAKTLVAKFLHSAALVLSLLKETLVEVMTVLR